MYVMPSVTGGIDIQNCFGKWLYRESKAFNTSAAMTSGSSGFSYDMQQVLQKSPPQPHEVMLSPAMFEMNLRT